MRTVVAHQATAPLIGIGAATALTVYGLSLAWLASASQQALAADLPPVQYQGELVTTLRNSRPSDGNDITQFASISRLSATSYVWQPWFATLGAGLSFSNVRSFGAADNQANLLGGEGDLRLFPRSNFPLTIFASVTDSRTELDVVQTQVHEVRRTRYGATQTYRPSTYNATYVLQIERQNESAGVDLFDQTSDRLSMQMTSRLGDHQFDGTASFQHQVQEGQEGQGSDLVDSLLTLGHFFRPSSELSVQTFASLTDVAVDSNGNDIRVTNSQVNSFATWRDPERPLTVSADARVSLVRSGTTSLAQQTQTLGAGIGATYALTDALRSTLNINGSTAGGTGGQTTTSQSVGLSYSPPGNTLAGFQHNWFANGNANNRTSEPEGAQQVTAASLGHAISRFWAWNALSASFSASEAGSMTFDSTAGNQSSITHSASLGIAHSLGEANSRAQLELTDNRIFSARAKASAGSAGATQSANLQLTHDSQFGRFSTLSGALNMSLVHQDFEEFGAQTYSSSSISVRYRHGRVFGVRRLRFLSELSANSDRLLLWRSKEDGNRDLTWENRLDYSIGRIEVRLTGVVREDNGKLDSTMFLSVRRRIGGTF